MSHGLITLSESAVDLKHLEESRLTLLHSLVTLDSEVTDGCQPLTKHFSFLTKIMKQNGLTVPSYLV